MAKKKKKDKIKAYSDKKDWESLSLTISHGKNSLKEKGKEGIKYKKQWPLKQLVSLYEQI